ncbi:MAG: LrgB family protein [Erysipelothrix sp.]|nr:LrgB family protein [Erysipelothrix sp.]
MELWSLCLTIVIYLGFQKLKDKYDKTWINPLLLTSVTLIFILLMTNTEYETYNQGVSFITSLLGPATVALAIPLYENKDIIVKYSKRIFISVMSGIVAHGVSIVILAKLLKLDLEMIATIVPKSVTTAIAKDIAAQYGGLVEITIALVIITGIFGAVISDFAFKLLKTKSPVSKGLALGVSAHAVGTSKAIEVGEIEATMSTIALILTGLITVLVAPVIMIILT